EEAAKERVIGEGRDEGLHARTHIDIDHGRRRLPDDRREGAGTLADRGDLLALGHGTAEGAYGEEGEHQADAGAPKQCQALHSTAFLLCAPKGPQESAGRVANYKGGRPTFEARLAAGQWPKPALSPHATAKLPLYEHDFLPNAPL